jgi:hypothetical protein
MPEVRIPLVGNYNASATPPNTLTDGGTLPLYGQFFQNAMFEVIDNKVTGSRTVYVKKRPGFYGAAVSSAGEDWTCIICPTFDTTTLYAAHGTANSTIRKSTNGTLNTSSASIGTITGVVRHLTEAYIGGVNRIFANSSDGTGWFYATDAGTGSPTFTGDTTNTNAVVANVSSTTGLYVGQAISGTGIPAGTRIQSIDSATQITMTANATATNATVTITRTPIAKIISANYPSSTAVGAFAFLDGFAFVMTSDGKVYNCDINDVTTWGAGSYIQAGNYPDGGVGVVRYKGSILAFGNASIEPMRNTGNAAFSPLSTSSEASIKIGAKHSQGIFSFEDEIYFLGLSEAGQAAVYKLGASGIEKISTQFMDYTIAALRRLSSDATIRLTGARILGTVLIFMHPGVSAVYGGSDRCVFVYDANADIWNHWIFGGSEIKIDSVAVYPSLGYMYACGSTGSMYQLRPAVTGVYLDQTTDGTTGRDVILRVVIGPLDLGTNNRKFIKSVAIGGCDVLDSGTGSIVLRTANSATSSDLSQGSVISTSTIDLTAANPIVHRCGSYKGGATYEIQVFLTPRRFRAKELIINYDVGAH